MVILIVSKDNLDIEARVTMIKVTGSSVADGEAELLLQAVRFFLDRLLPAAQQKKLTLNIDLTDRPGRPPIAIKWLIGSSGFFGWKPPRYFVMTVSVAAGVKDGLEAAANEIVHVAQTVSGRLKISLKNRKVNDKREDAYVASWMNGKFAFVDMTPRDNRVWETEAHQLKTQLVDEFLTWSAGSLKKLPTQKPKKNTYGLYAVRPQIIAAPVTIPTRPVSVTDEIYQLNDVVDLITQKPNVLADVPVVDKSEDGLTAPDDLTPISESDSLKIALPENTSPPGTINLASTQHVRGQRANDLHVMLNHLEIDSDEFRIAVNVPCLGMDRMLDSVMLHGKLNDLLERGLIPHAAARAAFRQAQQNRIGR